MSKIKAVLFDLDGTLLPMNQDVFAAAYFDELAKNFVPLGYDPRAFAAGVWQGMKAMFANNGEKTNEERFWESFTSAVGSEIRYKTDEFDDFYENKFCNVQKSCGYDARSAETVLAIKSRGLRTILATNPVFPATATFQRCRWAGLEPEMFEYISTFENSHFCKPNLRYYEEILEKTGLSPNECLMVGNDVGEDMVTEKLGMSVYLLCDCLINKVNADINEFPHGDLDSLVGFVENML